MPYMSCPVCGDPVRYTHWGDFGATYHVMADGSYQAITTGAQGVVATPPELKGKQYLTCLSGHDLEWVDEQRKRLKVKG